MSKLSEKETIELLDQFINESGLWNELSGWLDDKGIDVNELAIEDQ